MWDWNATVEGATCTVCNVLHGGGEDKRPNNRTMLPALRNNATVGYQGPVKIELLKGALLQQWKAYIGCIFRGAGKFGRYDPRDKTDRDGYSG